MERTLQAVMREWQQEWEELGELKRRELERGTQDYEIQSQCHSYLQKLKPDTFDKTELLRELLAQFDLVARANNPGERGKAVILTANLGAFRFKRVRREI